MALRFNGGVFQRNRRKADSCEKGAAGFVAKLRSGLQLIPKLIAVPAFPMVT
jgi:hypothetical protein